MRRPNLIDGEWRWSFARRQVIPDWSNPTRPYLRRWRFDSPFGSIFLHAIHLPDGDSDPHTHPFSQSVSLILRGGYTEYRGIDGTARRDYRAGMINRLSGTDVHRIAEIHGNKPAWTLFWAGTPHGRGWGFYVDGKYVDHKVYLAGRDAALSRT